MPQREDLASAKTQEATPGLSAGHSACLAGSCLPLPPQPSIPARPATLGASVVTHQAAFSGVTVLPRKVNTSTPTHSTTMDTANFLDVIAT